MLSLKIISFGICGLIGMHDEDIIEVALLIETDYVHYCIITLISSMDTM